MARLIVIALGGNALNSPEGRGDYFEQAKNASGAAKEIAKVVKSGYKIVITHGNGPQVGNILLQQECSKDYVPPLPLALCGAESQGQIGTILANALNNEFKKRGLKTSALCLVTHVLVDKNDPAFQNPTKPIGPIYTQKEVEKLKKEEEERIFREIKTGSFRRVVPSPLPLKILEIEGIKSLLAKNLAPIAVGGGGIPSVANKGGLKLINAVIDKDLASEVLASQLKADEFIILTNVKKVALNWGKPNQVFIDKLSLSEAKTHLKNGQFPAGSMGPKIQAAINFVESRGRKAVIARLDDLTSALRGEAGTVITKT